MRVRVLTLNVLNLEGDPRRQEVINAELRRLDPDLVSFQEMVQTPEQDQLKELLDGTGLHGTHQAETMSYVPPRADRFGGTAVAARWPHRVVETLDLRGEGEAIGPRCTLATVVDIPGEGEMLFIATTLSARLIDGALSRERQVVALTDLDSRHRRELPTVLAGDFNANPDAASIRYLTGLQSLSGQSAFYHDAWALAGDGPGYTWSCDNPLAGALHDQIVRQPGFRMRIDYIFVGSAGFQSGPGGGHAQVQSASLAFDRPFDGVWPSDHFGVLVDLEVGSQPLADPDLYPR